MSKSKVAMGFVGQLVKAAKPAAPVAGAVGAGAVGALVGGALAKQVPQIAAFAHGSEVMDAVVDAGGGLVVDGVALLGASMLLGKKTALEAAPFVFGGTLVAAFAPLALPYVEHLVDGIVGLVGGSHAALPSPGGLADGALDIIPGGATRGGIKDLF
jgi:hypothetical protein